MNTQKEVFNKLFKEDKTELSAQKIELGSIDELKNLQKEYFKTYDFTREVRRKGAELKKEAKSGVDFLNKIEKKIKQELNSFDKKAQDLGLDAKSVKVYQDLNRHLTSDIPNYMKIFKQALSVDTL